MTEERKKPTIAELERILDEQGSKAITLNPDGSISVNEPEQSEYDKGWNAAIDEVCFRLMGWTGDSETFPDLSKIKKLTPHP